MSSLLDTLTPATPPTPKNARTVRPLDHKDDEREPLTVAPLDPAKLTLTKAPPVNSKAASIRALLRDHPEGLGYDGLCKGTGIARDRIASHLANLLTAGDIKGYELPGRGRVFKITGIGTDKVGERKADQVPATASTAAPRSEGTQGTGLPEAGRVRRADAAASPGRPAAIVATTSTAADRKPADESISPATDRVSDSAATSQPAAPQTSATARTDTESLAVGGPARAADPETEAPQEPDTARPGPDPISGLPPARASAQPHQVIDIPLIKHDEAGFDSPRPPVIDSAHALAIELVCIAAKNAIAEVRGAFGNGDLRHTWPELHNAVENFERADRIYVSTKGRA